MAVGRRERPLALRPDGNRGPVSATPVVFGPDDRPLFGWVHQPEDRRARGTVVLCPPLFREAISAHFTYRVVAERLSAAGIAAIRFDYDGTGDSAGSDLDPGRMAAYEDSVDHAVQLARDLGTADVALLGMRMGGLLAARASARCPGVTALVLWDPCASGRDFLREQSALFRVTYGKSEDSVGSTEVAGFLLTAETAADLKAIAAPDSNRTVQRALLLTRPDRPPEGMFGLDVDRLDQAVARGQAGLLEIEPYRNAVPESVEEVVTWLESVLPVERRPQNFPPSRPEATFVDRVGGSVTERAVALGSHRLYGIETVGPGRVVGPMILFLSSGNESHIGPNRLWVDLARRLAGRGFSCLRFDLSGIGDSPVRPGAAEQLHRSPQASPRDTRAWPRPAPLNPLWFFDDIREVVDEVTGGREGDVLAPVVLVGLCSGGYQALESALDLKPLRGVVAINPILRFDPPERKSRGRVDGRRTFCQPVGRARSTYRRMPPWVPSRAMRRAYLAVSRLGRRRRTAVHWLTRMSERGTDVLCLSGPVDAEALFEGSKLAPGPEVTVGTHVRIEVIELDHGLIPSVDRARAIDRVTNYVTHVFSEQGAPTGPVSPSAVS